MELPPYKNIYLKDTTQDCHDCRYRYEHIQQNRHEIKYMYRTYLCIWGKVPKILVSGNKYYPKCQFKNKEPTNPCIDDFFSDNKNRI